MTYQLGTTDSFLSASNLTGKEGELVKIVSTGADKGKVEVCDAITDVAFGVVESGREVGQANAIRVLAPTVEVKIGATLNPGTIVATGTSGKAVAAVATSFPIGILKEGGVDGDLVPMYLTSLTAKA